MQETWVRSLGQEDPLEKEIETHFNILAWKISWREETGWLEFMGSQRVRHSWATEYIHIYVICAYLYWEYLYKTIYVCVHIYTESLFIDLFQVGTIRRWFILVMELFNELVFKLHSILKWSPLSGLNKNSKKVLWEYVLLTKSMRLLQALTKCLTRQMLYAW